MTVDMGLETLYGQIELIRGAGDRRRSRLCLMSFVAYLAGEGHSDDPATASPLVRRFAITINDEMPAALRQNLKAFAPRIIGTRDGRDSARAALLLDAAVTEILPRISAEFGETVRSLPTLGNLRRNARTWYAFHERMVGFTACNTARADTQTQEEIAFALARLICFCGQAASEPIQRGWYWAKAVDLLDRLCDVGAEDVRPAVPEKRVAAIADFLKHRRERDEKTRAARAWAGVRELIPVLIR